MYQSQGFRAVYESSQNGIKSLTAASGDQASADFGGFPEYESPFTLSDLAEVLLKRLWAILLVVAVVVGLAVGLSLWQAPTYEASALLMVGQDQAGGQDTNLAGSVEGLQQLTGNMIIAIDTRPVAEEAISRLGLEMSPEELLENLTIEQVETYQFIRLTYTDSDAERAEEIVNTVGAVSSERISNTGSAASNITATMMERAVVSDAPISPNPLRNGLLAAVLGLMLGVGLAFLMEYLDHGWHSPEEVERVAGVPTFGTIPEFSVAMRKKGR
jgi:capsular polysaccharide biosynthesis protein